MVFKKHHRRWVIVALILTALVPVIITAFEIVFTEDKSVVFLGNYNPKVAIIVLAYYGLLLASGIFWFTRQLILLNSLKNEKIRAELMLLKSQVSPHFFFNMLNNLYGLVAKDAEKAQTLILKLSDMMRYSIYEGEKESVTLKEEAEYLKNYIGLHSMRYHKSIDIHFNCEIEDNCKVSPLLFIILLENSFKHGVENLRGDAYVKVGIHSFKNKIQFTVENNFDSSGIKENNPGIGLKNLKRRLELIYPDKHDLSFSVTENVYRAQLILNKL